MKDEFIKLAELSKLDAEIVEILDIIEDTPRLITNLNQEISKIESPITLLTKELDQAITQKKGNDFSLTEKKEWVASREAKSKEIKTNKEYHAALKEVNDGQRLIAKLEEENKTLEAIIEEKNQKIAALKEEITQKSAAIREQIAQHEAAVAQSRSEADGKMKNRDEFEKSISPVLIKKYKSIFQRVKPALSLAAQGLCTECNTRIPPQLFIELQKPDVLKSCPQCHRILFLG
ncbi:hypothetical protein K1X76_01830 [bacterium]|nr:hypothetical protein [bacterium]